MSSTLGGSAAYVWEATSTSLLNILRGAGNNVADIQATYDNSEYCAVRMRLKRRELMNWRKPSMSKVMPLKIVLGS